MPGPFAALSGLPCVKASLSLPLAGAWTLDVTLDRPIDIVGPQVFTLADTVWKCAVVRAIDFSGSRSVRLVGGMGGWGKVVPLPQPYGAPFAQVPAALVLAGLAAAVQEPPPVLAGWLGTPTLGEYYCRPAGVAGVTLSTILGDDWWMDPLGVVQAALRLPTPIATPFAAMGVRGSVGLYTIATDFPGDWTPGRVFVSPTVQGIINRVRHVVTEGRLRTEVLVS